MESYFYNNIIGDLTCSREVLSITGGEGGAQAICNGTNSCYKADITGVNMKKMMCLGSNSCKNMQLSMSGGELECVDVGSCTDTMINAGIYDEFIYICVCLFVYIY